MKKFLTVLAILGFSISTAYAWPWHGWGGHHRPSPPVVEVHHPRPVYVRYGHHHSELDSFFAGLVGATIGSYIVTDTYHHPLYNTAPVRDTQCFLLVSKKTNKAVKRCVDITDDFNQDDIYKVLYID